MEIYAVTTIKVNNSGDITSKSVHGLFQDRERALSILENNSMDIFEFYYDYGIVEKIKLGMYPVTEVIKWMKLLDYVDNVAILEEVSTPEEFEMFTGFSL